MPAKRRQRIPGASRSVQKKKKRNEDPEDAVETDQFFMESDHEKEAEAEEQAEVAETAEEARLQLAKAFLKQLRAQGAALGEDDNLEGDEAGLDDEGVTQKLRQQVQEAGGFIQRQIAERVGLASSAEPTTSGRTEDGFKFHRCHRDAVTALALTHDDKIVYSVGKEGSIVKLDVERESKSTMYKPGKSTAVQLPDSGPEWVKKGPRHLRLTSLSAAAVSSDGNLLAVGGGDRKVHVWDTRTETLVQSFPGHKDAITGLAFRVGTHELYSASYDRSIKLWSLDDRAYVDSLFGHQAEVLAVDALRHERIVSTGHDHTCRVWKIPEESQLIFRGHATAMDCCKYVTGTEWVSGSSDGTLSAWTQLKKKPAFTVRDAHPNRGDMSSAQGAEAGWLQSLAVCRGSDLLASGAGDGFIRLWHYQKDNKLRSLQEVGSLPARGFVNSLAVATSARFVVAGLGQEPRLGRWARDKKGLCGLAVYPLSLSDEL